MIETFVVPEKQEEFMQLYRRYLKCKEENLEKYKEMKSSKLFAQMFGGMSVAHVEVVKFDSLADFEKCHKTVMKDEGFMKIQQEFMLLIDPATYSLNVWNSVM